ncbi:hypothetical protein PCE1_000932 [Barthelona sp. PCE]
MSKLPNKASFTPVFEQCSLIDLHSFISLFLSLKVIMFDSDDKKPSVTAYTSGASFALAMWLMIGSVIESGTDLSKANMWLHWLPYIFTMLGTFLLNFINPSSIFDNSADVGARCVVFVSLIVAFAGVVCSFVFIFMQPAFYAETHSAYLQVGANIAVFLASIIWLYGKSDSGSMM